MINLDGNIVNEENAKLSVLNRGFAYGDSVFETVRVINGKIMFWEDHYFRLMASMRIMRMEIPSSFSPEFLEKEIKDIIEANDLNSSAARIRFAVYRLQGGYYTPATREIGYVITTEAMENSFYLFNDNPYEIELFKDHYVNSGLLSTIKSNNRAVNVLGSIYARENDYDNCLLLNEKKSVVEALNGNIFLVKGNTIKTPPIADGALNGIIRTQLINILKKTEEYTLKETSISPFELQKADELFITNVAQGIQPVSKYRKKNFENKVSKYLLSKLNVKARLG
ncbi:aminotransferase class IV [Christiangramia echinicola]|uniref:branched-chain-amino-acid transaminase n=1 Tax=Christiangramia echinicola TaxID=279359 RepID=A0A1H1KSJ2_9FLAO|nr:aminotransferase class IV [Christiangramia echinicola]SDR64990.1 branched-chain amino acid aminotransferase [Christiangramia echinicola]SDS44555.1 branched-chain amino acid aminotransferase [Christiangramia echinicola]